MNRRIAIVLGVIPLFAASLALAETLQIAGTKHSPAGSTIWPSTEICKPCHTPHHAMPTSISTRLWNHKLTTASYNLQTGGTGAAETALDPISRLCMSCHDGTLGMDAFGGSGGSNAKKMPADGSTRSNLSMSRDPVSDGLIAGNTSTGNDLTNDHPVGIAATYAISGTSAAYYNQTIVENSTKTRWTVASRGSDTSQKVNLYKNSTGDYIVGCYSCHNPHGSGIDSNSKLLRVTSTNSDLCLTCHNK